VSTLGTTLTACRLFAVLCAGDPMPITDRRTERCADLFIVRCTPSLRAALQRASERELVSASAYVRGALLRRLREDGIEPLDQQVTT
jgi:hypothetical protein